MASAYCYLHKLFMGPKHFFSKYFLVKHIVVLVIFTELNDRVKKNVPAGCSTHICNSYWEVEAGGPGTKVILGDIESLRLAWAP